MTLQTRVSLGLPLPSPWRCRRRERPRHVQQLPHSLLHHGTHRIGAELARLPRWRWTGGTRVARPVVVEHDGATPHAPHGEKGLRRKSQRDTLQAREALAVLAADGRASD